MQEQIHGSKYNKKTDVWSLGCLIYELCSLSQPFNGNDLIELKENISKNRSVWSVLLYKNCNVIPAVAHFIYFFRLSRIPAIYSDYLDKMVKLLLSSNHEFRPSVEMIIHHPTVICNYDKNATPFMPAHRSQKDEEFSHSSSHRSPERRKVFVDEHIDNIIDKIEKLSRKTKQLSLESDPRAITEDVYNRKLMSRLKLLREKESVLKAKEDSLKTKEYILKTRESSLIQKQKLIERREREMEVATVKRVSGKSRSERTRPSSSTVRTEPIKCRKEIQRCLDLDSTTCSADPGDTSIYPTAAKLDPSKIIKPPFFKHHLKNVDDAKPEDSKNTYDVFGSGDCTRIAHADYERQPLSFLHNYTHGHSIKTSKSKVSVRKYQNYLYKK